MFYFVCNISKFNWIKKYKAWFNRLYFTRNYRNNTPLARIFMLVSLMGNKKKVFVRLNTKWTAFVKEPFMNVIVQKYK